MERQTQKHLITPANAGKRLDRFLRETLHVPQSVVQKMLRDGKVFVSGARVKKADYRLLENDSVENPVFEIKEQPKIKTYVPQKEDFAKLKAMILCEDEHIVVLNKPAGLAVQGGTGTKVHLDAMVQALKKSPQDEDFKLTHRIDKETSGLLIMAKNTHAARIFTKMFHDKTITKSYLALVKGMPPKLNGTIEAPLEKIAIKGHEKMRITETGLEAISLYEVLASQSGYSLVKLTPLTGRTHQLRAHMNFIGCPIIGDHKYGGKLADCPHNKNKRLFLHAAELSFTHMNGKNLNLKAPLDDELLNLLNTCGLAY